LLDQISDKKKRKEKINKLRKTQAEYFDIVEKGRYTAENLTKKKKKRLTRGGFILGEI